MKNVNIRENRKKRIKMNDRNKLENRKLVAIINKFKCSFSEKSIR